MNDQTSPSGVVCPWCDYESPMADVPRCPECGLGLDAAGIESAREARTTFREGRVCLAIALIGCLTRWSFAAVSKVRTAALLDAALASAWSTFWLVACGAAIWYWSSHAERLIARSHSEHLNLRGMCFLWAMGHAAGLITVF